MDAEHAFARAERAYERGRVVFALKKTAPLVIVIVLALVLGGRLSASLGLGVAILALGAVFSWRGQAFGRSVLPGVVAGAVPLTLALAAQAYGHVCTGSGCMSLCVPACSLGGAIAGVLVVLGTRSLGDATSKSAFVASASGLALLVGSLGCSCVGYGGVVGLAVGLVTTLVPSSLLLKRA